MATIHDCDGNLVAYSLSAFAYSVKSHPRNSKRALRASTDDSEDTGNSRSKRRRPNPALITTSTTSTSGNYALPSNSFTTGSSNQQQSGGSANTGRPPTVYPAVGPSRGVPIPMLDQQLRYLAHGTCSILSSKPTEAYQPIPTLFDVIPPSCTWDTGSDVSLFVNNLPQDGPIYARFGGIVVATVGG